MANAFKLYELSDQMRRIAEMIEDGIEGLEDTLEAIEGSFEDKVEGTIKVVRSHQAERDAIKAEIDRLKARAEKLDKGADKLLAYVEREMLATNTYKVPSKLFDIRLGLTPPAVKIADTGKVPDEYIRRSVTESPDKAAIKLDIQRGIEIPGCTLEQKYTLRVK